ncbi:MAG: hypothetical protein NXH75_00070 [Halobacteriovoraceae bacterium]|nr:hypothetical protein [Halobacteriovoraceae bacterium]
MYLGFITWTTSTFFKTQTEINKASADLKKRNELSHKVDLDNYRKILKTVSSNKTASPFDSEKIYCPLTKDTSPYYLLFANKKYFLIHKTLFNSFPFVGTRLVENGDYLEGEEELWLLDSYGKTLKRLKLESKAFSDEGDVPVLNYFGEYLSYKFCPKKINKNLEEFAKTLLGEFFPNT